MYCRWRLYIAGWYARAWSSSCSQAVTLSATRLFLYAARQVYNYTAACSFGRYNRPLKRARYWTEQHSFTMRPASCRLASRPTC